MEQTNKIAQENVTRVDAYVATCPYCGLELPMGSSFNNKPYAAREEAEQSLVRHLVSCSLNPTSMPCCGNCVYGVEMEERRNDGACTKTGVRNVSCYTVCPQHKRRYGPYAHLKVGKQK